MIVCWSIRDDRVRSSGRRVACFGALLEAEDDLQCASIRGGTVDRVTTEFAGIAGVEGLRYASDWVRASEQVRLLAAIDAAPWSSELRRRVQHFGHRYDYGRRSVAVREPAAPLPGWACELVERLEWDVAPDQVIVNEYLPGQGIGPHIDCVPCFGPVVATLSLGSACTMDFLAPEGGVCVPVRLAPGSLCEMTREARYRWRHTIAARKTDPSPSGRVSRGRRVSVTFRTVLTGTSASSPS
ncbi:alpha-ketoglutarate-dependent dioxygenase AlkB [Nocardia testacea]|uniref:alpha-ketoglutarate-dependent dioxygenase AlkB n=1 Tax=Nocardia testacea TaxID=248551 RepID=UPI000A00F5DA|nr:alpha-ketoglutarate-dependent dioxygenase AlkB [Nocardia testacea]